MYGKPMMAWQMDDLHAMTAVGPDGRWANPECGKSIPRQAGKTTDVEGWVIDLAMVHGYRVLWTAHNYDTTSKTLEDFRDVLGTKPGDKLRGLPEFNAHLLRSSSKTSQESYTFKPFTPGAREGFISFSTRTRTSKLGSTFDVVVIDEAQEVTQEHLKALLPTTVSGPSHNPQYIWLGTPRRAGSLAKEFEDMRAELIGDNPPAGSAWLEYGLPEIGDIEDESRWYQANPSLGEGVADISAIRQLKKRLSSVSFAQECLGVWLTPGELAGPAGDPVIGRGEWQACASGEVAPDGPRAYAVKFAPDGSTFAVCVAVAMQDGVRVELVDHRAAAGGKAALATFVADRARRWPVVVDGKAGAGSLRERVLGVDPELDVECVTPSDFISACQELKDAVDERSMSWYLPPGSALDWERPDELSSCVTSARRRSIGRDGGWGFDGDGADVAEAAAMAMWRLRAQGAEEPMEVVF